MSHTKHNHADVMNRCVVDGVCCYEASPLGDVPVTFNSTDPARYPLCAAECGRHVEYADETLCERCQDEAERYDYADDVPARGF